MCATGSDKRRASPTMAEIWTAASQQEGIDFNKIKKDVRYTTPSGGENIELLRWDNTEKCLVLTTQDHGRINSRRTYRRDHAGTDHNKHDQGHGS